ncbi:MAG: hypothetical protein NDJ89_04655 [Oligoflexia bacterium]|nr:hypothetical protein [Oligoflexia bacterium]
MAIAAETGSFFPDNDLPPPEAPADRAYRALTTRFTDPAEILASRELTGTLRALRSIATLTPEYHRDLLRLLEDARSVDSAHLLLLLDACYFPHATLARIDTLLESLAPCAQSACQHRVARLRENRALAAEYGAFTRALLLLGLPKLEDPSLDSARALLERLFPASEPDSSDDVFSLALGAIPAIDSPDRLAFARLSAEKGAWGRMATLSREWFEHDSDRSARSFLAFAQELPQSRARDLLILDVARRIDRLSRADARAMLSLASEDPSAIAAVTLGKVGPLDGAAIASIAAGIRDSEGRDSVLFAALPFLTAPGPADARALLSQAAGGRAALASRLFSALSALSAEELVLIAHGIMEGPDREDILLQGLPYLTALTSSGARTILGATRGAALEAARFLLPRLPELTASQLAELASAMGYGPDRDRVLTLGLGHLIRVDLAGTQAMLRQAYRSHAELASALFPRLAALSAQELATLAKLAPESATREQLLLNGAAHVTSFSREGVLAVITAASERRATVAAAILARMPGLDAETLAAAAETAPNGEMRDTIIGDGIGLLTSVTPEGVALLVEKSMQHKTIVALTLLPRIPGFRGRHLALTLKACGSGMIRDQILAGALPLLPPLSGEEAKTLAAFAYENKAAVAIQLLQKVERVDAQVVADVARASPNPRTRDAIITGGLEFLTSLDTAGLVALIKAADRVAEKLATDGFRKVKDLKAEDVIEICRQFPDLDARDRLLVLSVEFVAEIDEAAITLLAVNATDRNVKKEIVRKGMARMDEAEDE